MSTPKVRPKKIKKWIVSGEDDEKTVVAFGGTPGKDKKIIIKALEKGINEHFTMMVSKDGYVDFHKTEEGTIKSHTPLMKGKADPRKIEQYIRGVVSKQLKTPIDPKDQAYQEHIVLIPKSKEKLTEFVERFYIRDGKMIIPDIKASEKIEQSIEDYFIVDYLSEIRKHAFSLAFVINPEEENPDYLLHINNDCFLVGVNEKELDGILKKHFKIEWLKSEDQESTR